MRVPLEALPLPALVLDEALTIAAANQLAMEALGAGARRLHGAPLAHWFGPEPELARLVRHAEAGPARSFALLVAGKPASVWLGRQEMGWLLVFALDATKAELEELTRRREKADLVARLALELAHEVKNPLAGMQAAAEWLAERLAGEPELAEAARLVLQASNRIRARMDALLLLGPRAKTPMARVNLHELIDEVSVGAPAGVRVFRNFDPGLPEVLAHRARLAQALENLWRNALEAGASWVEWRTSARPLSPPPGIAGGAVELRITNDGEPVPAEIRAHAFEPFVSGKRKGSGLGLAIVEQVMREHGGRARLVAERGRTSVILHLPLQPPEEPCGR